MYEVASKDPAHTLLLTILREVGLRVTALLHLKFTMLLDANRQPRNVCSVPEKAQTMRQFVPSANLKSKIRDYVNIIGETFHLDMFVFYPHGSASRSSIAATLKQIAHRADIEVNIHPHIFRHTLVGKLLEVGNPIEIAARYLMRHTNSYTTPKNIILCQRSNNSNNRCKIRFQKHFGQNDANWKKAIWITNF